MRRSPWSISIIGLAIGSLAVVGGTAIGDELGPLTVGYGALIGLAAVYALVGLAVRDRGWRRIWPARGVSGVKMVAGHRLF